MQFIRQNILLKYLWISLTIFIFNFSIDAPDVYGDAVAEDLSFNDIESISELILEDVLGIYNAFPEHDENDLEDDGGFCKKFEYKCEKRVCFEQIPLPEYKEKREYFESISTHPQSPFLKGLIKPPQA